MCRSGSDSDSGSGSGSGSSDSSAEEENSDESVSDYEPSHKVKSRKPSNKYSFPLLSWFTLAILCSDALKFWPPKFIGRKWHFSGFGRKRKIYAGPPLNV